MLPDSSRLFAMRRQGERNALAFAAACPLLFTSLAVFRMSGWSAVMPPVPSWRSRRRLSLVSCAMGASTAGTKQREPVRIEGVSLIASYRSSFNAEIEAGGIQGLLDMLKENNRKQVARRNGDSRTARAGTC